MLSALKTVGTLLPVTALPQGTFADGFRFLQWLHDTNQSAWQMLPLNESQLETGSATKHVPSPYKGYGIGLSPQYLPPSFARKKLTSQERNKFIRQHNAWITDYALFCAIRDQYGTDDWRAWESGLQNREEKILAAWTGKLSDKINFYITQQWQLHQSFEELRKEAKKFGIALISDMPYYLSVKSPLVWAHRSVFQIQKDGTMAVVSGVPNTSGAHFGRQVWGHPLYNWQLKEKVIAFWKLRLGYQTKFFDAMRFDHAKAFFSYGVMDPQREENDRYEDGPGSEIFDALIAFSRDLKLEVFAEDSGDNVQQLRDCLTKLEISGIRIYRFAMKEEDGIINTKYADITKYPENCVAYTTTHDTEPMLGYLKLLLPKQKQQLAAAARVGYDPDDRELATLIRNAIISSSAGTVIIPIQDWLLTTDRINIPGTEVAVDDPNWRFKLDRPIESLPTEF